MCANPACRKLRPADSKVLLKAASAIEIVPGNRMCPAGGEIVPSGT